VTNIYLIRHGVTDYNQEGRWQGQISVPLNELGREQARLLANRLACEPIVAVYSSDLSRASETAEILAAALRVPLCIDRRLREVSVGAWEGLLSEEVRERFPEGYQSWTTLREGRPGGPTGEEFHEAQGRMVEALDTIAARHPGQTVAVVSHGFVIKAFVCYCLDLPPEGTLRFAGGDNTAISMVQYRDGIPPRLMRLNDEAHLNTPCPAPRIDEVE
jgi:broad specificity phosphatase PhoE